MTRSSEFTAIYDAHRHAVHAYFLGRLADRARAADLMQEVFLRVWRRLPEVASLPVERQRAWIFTVARNLSTDSYRRASTAAGLDAALRSELGSGHSGGTNGARSAARIGVTAAAPAADSRLVAAERLAVVTEAIERLPEPQRVALTMAAAGDLTSADIGTALGVPAGTIRYRLSLARRSLAEALAAYDDGAPVVPSSVAGGTRRASAPESHATGVPDACIRAPTNRDNLPRTATNEEGP